MWRVDSLEKTLMLGGIRVRRRRGRQRMRCWMASPTRGTWVWVNSGSLWWTGVPGVLWFKGSQRVGHDWVTELNWTKHIYPYCCPENALSRRKKDFSTCGPHLTVFPVFYGNLFFMCLGSPTEESVEQGKIVAIFYMTVIPKCWTLWFIVSATKMWRRSWAKQLAEQL